MLYGINSFTAPFSFENLKRTVEDASSFFTRLYETVSMVATEYLSSCLRKDPHEPIGPQALNALIQSHSQLLYLDLDQLDNFSRVNRSFRELALESFQEKKAPEAKKARDLLRVWKCLAAAIHEKPPAIAPQASDKELINIASGFSDWFEQNQEAFNQITVLDLSNNNLETLPIEITNLQNLINLNLSNNNLETLPLEIGNLQNLSDLDLSNNNLETPPLEIGNLQNLSDLDLSNNNLETPPLEIGNLQNLRVLCLQNNNLKTLPIEITNLQNLRFLLLYNNNLETLPIEITNLQNLEVLRLENNNLETLPLAITNLQNLSYLYLENNNLKTLPHEITNLQNLERLYLSNNNLETLPIEITNLQNLRALELKNNKLDEASHQLVAGIEDRGVWVTT